jgi:pimeloyl-ACP methyl ester carboxylesterase
MSIPITPFTIDVPQTALEDLSSRLKQTRWTDEPVNAGWNYGTDPTYLKELAAHWQTQYDWRTHETALNLHPQFRVVIDGIGVHFIHVRGKGGAAPALLLIHGWPDSFYRFHKVIPMLTNPGAHGLNPNIPFDLVIPSIPGFGFSDKVAQSSDKTATLLAKLMTEVLGYKTFFAAGGDIGSTISKSLANQYPSLVPAIHITDVGYPTGQEDWATMSAPEQEFGKFIQQWWFAEGAYSMLQATKPQTAGYGLNDSPIGLASWIVEKLHGWSGKPESLDRHFTKDEIITNIMIYWISETINTSMRTYAEEMRAQWSGGLKSTAKVDVPTGVSLFPGEAPFPDEWVNRMVNAKSIRRLDKGGHFAAWDCPKIWAGEVQDFLGKY